MNLPDSLLDPAWQWLGWGLFAAAFLLALVRAPWGRLADSTQSNVWLGTVVTLTLLWSIKAGVLPGLNLHLLGAMVFNLECGPWLAFVGLSLVLAGITVNGAAGWESFGLNALLMAGLPVLLAYGILRFNQKRLSKNPFVFIFANGFFGSALTILATGAAATALLAAGGAYPLDKLL
ncbi:MAG TPA: energy-coupling factor ABC transporter permease, partial [Azospira sp.]|nr:energy-coupling factor ABC transporter permease [Azospira sp.]